MLAAYMLKKGLMLLWIPISIPFPPPLLIYFLFNTLFFIAVASALGFLLPWPVANEDQKLLLLNSEVHEESEQRQERTDMMNKNKHIVFLQEVEIA